MSTIAPSRHPSSEVLERTAASTTERPSDILCEYDGHQIRTHIGMPESGEVDTVVLIAHGLRSSGDAFKPLGTELRKRYENTAIVTFDQLIIPPVKSWRELPGYLHETNVGSIRKLRAGTLEKVGAVVLKRFGLDSLDMITHSLSAKDGTEVAAKPSLESQFAVNSLTMLSPAGFVEPKDRPRVAVRAMRAKCGPKAPSQKGWVRDPHFSQHMSEYLYGLQNSSEQVVTAAENGVDVRVIVSANENIWLPCSFPDIITKIRELRDGCACHFAATHPHEAPRIADAISEFGFGRQASASV